MFFQGYAILDQFKFMLTPKMYINNKEMVDASAKKKKLKITKLQKYCAKGSWLT